MRRQIGPSVKVTNGCLGFVYWSGGICVEAILVTKPEREKHQNSLFSGHVLVVHSRNRREPLYGFVKPVWEEKWARSIALIVRSPYFSDDHHGRQDMPGNTKVYMRREMHVAPVTGQASSLHSWEAPTKKDACSNGTLPNSFSTSVKRTFWGTYILLILRQFFKMAIMTLERHILTTTVVKNDS